MKEIARRLRLSSPWWIYAAALVPVGILYAAALVTTNTLPLNLAIRQSVLYVIPVSVTGVFAWWLSGKLSDRFSTAAIVAIHLGVGILSTLGWVFLVVASIAIAANWAVAVTAARSFAAFQFMDNMFVYGVLATGSHVIRISMRLREQEARTARADALRMRAELAALRGQLNPHFLFNTLHTLTALVTREPAAAEHALERFGDMLRYVLDVKRAAREDVTLAEELGFVRDYLSLEQLRLGDRLRVVERVDPEALDCVVPSLTLQPLVENAIKHAVAPKVRVGTIEIGAALQGDSLVLEVRDDGPGATLADVGVAKGMGLRAVRQRLETRYPNESSFKVTTAPNEGFAVRATIPAHAASALPVDATPAATAIVT